MKKILVLLGIAALSLSAFATNPGGGTSTASCTSTVTLTVEKACSVGTANADYTQVLNDTAALTLSMSAYPGNKSCSAYVPFFATANFAFKVSGAITKIPENGSVVAGTPAEWNVQVKKMADLPKGISETIYAANYVNAATTGGYTGEIADLVANGIKSMAKVTYTPVTMLGAMDYENGIMTLTVGQ